jgi:hypothetical protein
VAAGKRIIGGFFVMMMGLGLILDTSWTTMGTLTAAGGLALVLWGAVDRK